MSRIPNFLFLSLLVCAPLHAAELSPAFTAGPGYRHYPAFAYAEPPVGALRFEPPREVKGLREAVPRACPQTGGDSASGTLPPSGEDCLQLTVWAPDPAPASPAPVIVYIHGGGLIAGSGLGSAYDGARFARRGFVFVSINYRLGPLGFLDRAGGDGSHPLGLLDQGAALRWVALNVLRLGGDPDNVTLLGHSMGAFSIRRLVELRMAPPGVKRAILLSPGSMFGKLAGRIGEGEVAGLRKVAWPELLRKLEGRLLSFPRSPADTGSWHGVRLLQTVLDGEEPGPFRDRLCEAEALAAEAEPFTESYLYVLHGAGRSHGDEVSRLFSGADPGEALLDFFLTFARDGVPPPSFVLWSAPSFHRASPRVSHWHRWYTYASAPKEQCP